MTILLTILLVLIVSHFDINTSILDLIILTSSFCFVLCIFCVSVERNVKRRQVKPLAASLLDALDYDSSDDSDFEVGDASGTLLFLGPFCLKINK